MSIREDQLNGRIATVIRDSVSGLQWTVMEETEGTLSSSQKRPDILIKRPYPEPPIVLENEYSLANVEGDCLNKLGQTLTPENGGQTIRVVVGIHSPKRLRDAANGDEATELLRNGQELKYAVYTGDPENYERFPRNGLITGDIRNLVEFIKPAAEPEDIIKAAADVLADGASVAATAMLSDRAASEYGPKIAEKLRQPWPAAPTDNPIQAAADMEACRQTANMAATIIINALSYQQILDGHKGIKGLAQLREDAPGKRLAKDSVVAEFDHILSINFWPIFHIAKELLLQIPARAAQNILENMAATADAILPAIRHSDIAGTLFQRLIADRKTLKAYYTEPAATTLMAHLAIPEDLDWGDPETVKKYSVADYACGSGGIMLASYQRVRDLHRVHGGDPDELHAHMMSECLTACDIMPAGVHLTASLLSSVAPTVPYDKTRCILFPFGAQFRTDSNGQIITDEDGNPIKETDGKGKPVVHVGSIALLSVKEEVHQLVMPPDEQAALGAQAESRAIEVPIQPISQSLVAMNPPFTSPTKHSPRASGHVDPANPAFAAFGTDSEDQKAMKALERKLGRNTISDGNAGLGTTFAAIADNMVKSGGRIALILPTSAMMGGSYDVGKRQAYSWQKLRNLICEYYDQTVVVSIAQPEPKESAFSADSNFADCILIARRFRELPAARSAHFVNLKRLPKTKLEGQEMARAVKAAISQTPKLNESAAVKIGDDEIGFVYHDAVQANRRWGAVRIAEPSLLPRAKALASGKLILPRTSSPRDLPVTTIGEIGELGPIARDITESNRGPFAKNAGCKSTDEYPILWNHAPVGKNRQDHLQNTMLTAPDSHGVPKRNKLQKAVELWDGSAAHLHINVILHFNANPTAAAFTEKKSLGGRAWPTLRLASVDLEKALCVWLNSTLGIIGYWLESNRNQPGRAATSTTACVDMPALDVVNLAPARLSAAVKIFDNLKDKVMLPPNEAWRDPVRQELDARLFTEVLGLDESDVERFETFRNQWCAEPSVTGTKGTGPR